MSFKTWIAEPENKSLLETSECDINVAQIIWDAAKLEAVNEYLHLILEGKLVVNLSKKKRQSF